MSRSSELPQDAFRPVPTENNHAELYIDGPENLSMLLSLIEQARHYIHVQVMLFYSDEAGLKIARALAKKACEGVDVRVMSDSGMSKTVRAIEQFRSSGSSDFSELQKLFAEAGVRYQASDKESYRLKHWRRKRISLEQQGVPEEFLIMQDVIQKGILLNLNVFDHRKIIVFDGETAVVGGMNLGNKYLYARHPKQSDEDRDQFWHDGSLVLKGPCVTALNKQFASKWMVRGGDVFDYTKHYRRKKAYGTMPCTIYQFFPGMKINYIRNYYLHKIRECLGRFIIENPYINDRRFWNELTKLDRKQAEKIILINPYKAKGNDYIQNTSAVRCHMWKPHQNGVHFYRYNRMTHWKIALDEAEDEVFLGSYNLNYRSALHDFELNVLVKSSELARRVREMLEKDMANSTRITESDEFYRYPYCHPSCLLLRITEYFE